MTSAPSGYEEDYSYFQTSATFIDCKTVRIFAYSSTREQSNKGETRELRARKTISDFFTDFEKKTDCFAV